MGLLDDEEFLKKRKPNLLADVRQLQRPSDPYLRQQYPAVFGGLAGLVGMAPDEMGGSVLDPNTARVREAQAMTYPIGTALQMLPGAKPAAAGAMAAGRAGERFAERAVPLVMERGGMGAEMLQGMSRGTVSPMGELTVTGRRPTQVDPNALVFREKVQNRKADLKADTDDFDPIVVIDDSGKLSILDGHNRAAVAKDRGDSLAAVKINQAEYDALQAQGFEDGEIAWAALQRANQSYAAGNLNSQFPGADIARGGDKAWDALIDFKDSPKGMVKETYAGFATPEQYNAAKFYGQNQTERWPAAWQRAGAVTPEEILRGKGIVQPPPTQRDKDLYLLESRFSGYMNASKARQFLENDMLKATKKEKDLLRKYYDASGKFIARKEVPVQLERNGQPMIARTQQQDATPDLLQYQQMLDEEERRKSAGLLFR